MDGQHKLCEYICLKCYLRILFICEIYILIINVLSNKKTSGCPLKSTLKGECYKISLPTFCSRNSSVPGELVRFREDIWLLSSNFAC